MHRDAYGHGRREGVAHWQGSAAGPNRGGAQGHGGAEGTEHGQEGARELEVEGGHVQEYLSSRYHRRTVSQPNLDALVSRQQQQQQHQQQQRPRGIVSSPPHEASPFLRRSTTYTTPFPVSSSAPPAPAAAAAALAATLERGSLALSRARDRLPPPLNLPLTLSASSFVPASPASYSPAAVLNDAREGRVLSSSHDGRMGMSSGSGGRGTPFTAAAVAALVAREGLGGPAGGGSCGGSPRSLISPQMQHMAGSPKFQVVSPRLQGAMHRLLMAQSDLTPRLPADAITSAVAAPVSANGASGGGGVGVGADAGTIRTGRSPSSQFWDRAEGEPIFDKGSGGLFSAKRRSGGRVGAGGGGGGGNAGGAGASAGAYDVEADQFPRHSRSHSHSYLSPFRSAQPSPSPLSPISAQHDCSPPTPRNRHKRGPSEASVLPISATYLRATPPTLSPAGLISPAAAGASLRPRFLSSGSLPSPALSATGVELSFRRTPSPAPSPASVASALSAPLRSPPGLSAASASGGAASVGSGGSPAAGAAAATAQGFLNRDFSFGRRPASAGARTNFLERYEAGGAGAGETAGGGGSSRGWAPGRVIGGAGNGSRGRWSESDAGSEEGVGEAGGKAGRAGESEGATRLGNGGVTGEERREGVNEKQATGGKRGSGRAGGASGGESDGGRASDGNSSSAGPRAGRTRSPNGSGLIGEETVRHAGAHEESRGDKEGEESREGSERRVGGGGSGHRGHSHSWWARKSARSLDLRRLWVPPGGDEGAQGKGEGARGEKSGQSGQSGEGDGCVSKETKEEGEKKGASGAVGSGSGSGSSSSKAGGGLLGVFSGRGRFSRRFSNTSFDSSWWDARHASAAAPAPNAASAAATASTSASASAATSSAPAPAAPAAASASGERGGGVVAGVGRGQGSSRSKSSSGSGSESAAGGGRGSGEGVREAAEVGMVAERGGGAEGGSVAGAAGGVSRGGGGGVAGGGGSGDVVGGEEERGLLGNGLTDLKRRYEVGERIGEGRSGVVVRACVERRSRQRFACKSIAKSTLGDAKKVEALLVEVDVMQRVKGHPHIVSLHEALEDAQDVHLVMEMCSGGDLLSHINSAPHISERQAACVTHSIASAVALCHRHGVCHRDLKPENVLLASKGGPLGDLRVADFGISTFVQPGQRMRGYAGSPFYIAPEVLEGRYGLEVDVWSMGVILYTLLSQRLPFWHSTDIGVYQAILRGAVDTQSGAWVHVSREAAGLVRRMLCLDVQERITVQGVLEHPWVLQHVNDTTPLPQPAPDLPNWKLSKRRRAIARSRARITPSFRLPSCLTPAADADVSGSGSGGSNGGSVRRGGGGALSSRREGDYSPRDNNGGGYYDEDEEDEEDAVVTGFILAAPPGATPTVPPALNKGEEFPQLSAAPRMQPLALLSPSPLPAASAGKRVGVNGGSGVGGGGGGRGRGEDVEGGGGEGEMVSMPSSVPALLLSSSPSMKRLPLKSKGSRT
ncbi:unnamed protein product [Closterium sp. Naga37s-1]|nr:unnamed protein product [Closterium sp. Naga37s-1]